jgi:hypothetical protein
MKENKQVLSISISVRISLIILLLICFSISSPVNSLAVPTLNFSDIESGPMTGNTDGAGGLSSSQHGAIVTIWGNDLGSSQGSSKVFIGSVEAAHIYYWKDADGALPGGPADLKTYHKMQEIAFSIPAGVPYGATTIKVNVVGVGSTTLPFTVRAGNIRYIKAGGVNSGAGTWSNPWASLAYVASGAVGTMAAGDIVYSVGIGFTSPLTLAGPLSGTISNPISVIAYPNTSVAFSGVGGSGYTVYNTGNNPSGYWNFSKIKVTTTGSAFNPIKGARWIGLEITGPAVYAGMSGAIGGSNTEQAGGGKLYGLYIHHYGTDNGVPTAGNVGTGSSQYPAALGTKWDSYHHLFYLSARTNASDPGGAKTIDGYEIAWGHFTDNPIYQGIHIYDMSESVGWVSPIRIHHNVVKNQRGNAINVDLPHLVTTPIEIHDNICISDSTDVYGVAAIHVVIYNSTLPIKIFNNTFYGYNAQNSLVGGVIDYRNNIMFDTKGVQFYAGTPSSQSNNLFFSSFNSSLAIPSWASGAVKVDPLFNDPTNGDFGLKPDSPVRYAGSESVLPTSPTDFFGNLRKSGSIGIGAIDFHAAPQNHYDAAPKNLKKL